MTDDVDQEDVNVAIKIASGRALAHVEHPSAGVSALVSAPVPIERDRVANALDRGIVGAIVGR